MKNPAVSISCITYNHGPYLRQCLDSFLVQRDVAFEVLIHDDCSTDETVDIIKEYAKKYPDVIRPLFEKENQYSKGIHNISGVFNFPRARGRYIAMCEGDDFWNDCCKLKKQVEYMDAHPECTLLAHSAKIVSEDGAFHSSDLIRPYEGHRDLSPEEVISKPVNFPMASLMFPAELAKHLPQWYFDCPVGDIPLHLYMLEKGTVHYMDAPMSTYRMGRAGSWGAAMDRAGSSADAAGVDPAGEAAKQRNKWEAHFGAMQKLYREFDRETGGCYSAAVEDSLRRTRFLVDLKEGKMEAVRDGSNGKYLRELGKMQMRLLQLDAYAPRLYGLIRTVWKKTRGGSKEGK